MDEEEARREAARQYQERITWRPVTMERAFTRRSLSPGDAHARVALPHATGEFGEAEGGPAYAVFEFNEPGETMELMFYGVGEPRDEVVARVWGLDRVDGPCERPAVHLCDIHARLWESDQLGSGGGSMPFGTRLAQWVEIAEDRAPFPGVHLGYISGTRGGSPWIYLPDAWGFQAFLIEMALMNPSGGPAALGAGAFWRSYLRPRPRPIPPELLDPKRNLERLLEQFEDEKREREGEEWKGEGQDAGPEEPG